MDGIREYSESIPDEEIIKDALALWQDIVDYEAHIRNEMIDDIKFANGEHWDEDIKRGRDFELRPSLVVPRLNQFLNKVKNETRQNKVSIKVSAGDGESPEKLRVKQAERRQQRIRKIQYDSCAMDAYQTAYDFEVDCGRGYFRLRTDYADNKSFKQKIIIDEIDNPLRVYMDKKYKHGFILSDINKDVFKIKYPDAEPAHFADEPNNHEWLQGDSVTLAEFYCTWTKKRTLLKFEDGTELFEDEIEEIDIEPVKKRVVNEPYIMWYKMTACEILDKKHIPGKYVPIIESVGVKKNIAGRLDIKGMVRDAKDTQKMYDYWCSNEAELLQLAVKSEYIIADGQMKGYEKYWKYANTKNYPALPYKPMSIGGSLVPPPSRQMPKQPDMALLQAKQGCIEDMKAITGIYDPSLGNASNETSGRAIMARQRQSDIANAHFPDGLRKALTLAGKIINEWIPLIDDGEVQGLNEEDEETSIKLGEYEDGEEVSYGDGDFDVVVTMGPDFTTRRQESLEMMMELLKIVPQTAPLIYDLLVKNIDAPGAQEIADRLRKTIPPQILEQEGGEQQLQQNLQQAMQQIQKDKMMIEALQGQLQKVMQELEGKNLESATKLKVAQVNAMADVQVANIRAQSDQQKEDKKISQMFYKSLETTNKGET